MGHHKEISRQATRGVVNDAPGRLTRICSISEGS